MPFIDARKEPLETDHPFAKPCIVFGAKQPDSSPSPSTNTTAASDAISQGETREDSLAQVKMMGEMDDFVKVLNDTDRLKEQSASGDLITPEDTDK